jgi:hypothetical protein
MKMKNNKVSPITVVLLCTLFLLQGLSLEAAGPSEAVRHEAFMRGGKAIAVALTVPAPPAQPLPLPIAEAAPPAPRTVPPAPQGSSQSSMSKPMWALLIGGFAASGIIIYKIASGPGASIRNCSTCSK